MSDKPDHEPSFGWPRAVAMLGAAALLAAAVFGVAKLLIDNNRAFDIVLDRSAGVTISAKSGEGIEVLIDRAFAESPAAVGGVLQARDYFKLHSDGLITALALTDPSSLPETTLKRYRKLLWELEGPFAPPGTLSEMDGRLLQALEDLEAEVRNTGRSNQLIAAIWQQSLNQQGIFRPRLVNAEVVLLSGNGAAGKMPVFYTCAGSTLINRQVTIAPKARGAAGPDIASEMMTGIVSFNAFLAEPLDCRDQAGVDFPELVAGAPLVLGLQADSYEKLFGLEEGSDAGPGPDGSDTRQALVQVEAFRLP